jgi:hypothetical protein
MRISPKATLLVGFGWAATALADPRIEESGKSRWGAGYERGEDGSREGYYRDYGGGRKEEYWSAGCKIEQKWDGREYKEEHTCKRGWNLGIGGRFR